MVKRQENGKMIFKVIGDFSFDDLTEMLSLEAECARFDIPHFQSGKFSIIDKELYCFHSKNGTPEGVWRFFDSSVRRWQECSDPTKEA